MQRHNSITIVDNLAEITRHHDRQVLEKSLLRTLNELFPNQGLRLFRVKRQELIHEISLLAFCINDVIVSADNSPKLNTDVEDLGQAMLSAIEKEDIVMSQEDAHHTRIIYPAFDAQGDIFALLVHQSEQIPEHSDQRLVYGILKVYANYLALIEKTQRDKLTSLYNRETLDEQITKLLVNQSAEFAHHFTRIEGSRRQQAEPRHWLGIIDIDHFKNINDTYGHLYGDEVIILIARLMTSGTIRDDDLVFRYGGEEFVVLLKAANDADASIAFNRLNKLVESHVFPQVGQVTVSIGFVEIADQIAPSNVIGQADDALYYAKQMGRNQVHSYHQLISEGKINHSTHTFHNSIELF